jgi:hypothetical protein
MTTPGAGLVATPVDPAVTRAVILDVTAAVLAGQLTTIGMRGVRYLLLGCLANLEHRLEVVAVAGLYQGQDIICTMLGSRGLKPLPGKLQPIGEVLPVAGLSQEWPDRRSGHPQGRHTSVTSLGLMVR